MTPQERKELEELFNTLCFAMPADGIHYPACTLPKNHEGSHHCDYEQLERYSYLRRIYQAIPG